MEIREITEGVWDAVKAAGGAIGTASGLWQAGVDKDPRKSAAASAEVLQQRYGSRDPTKEITWEEKYKVISADPASQQFVRGIMSNWPTAATKIFQQAQQAAGETLKSNQATKNAPVATPQAPGIVKPGETIAGVGPDDPRYAGLLATANKAKTTESVAEALSDLPGAKPGAGNPLPGSLQRTALPGGGQQLYIEYTKLFADWINTNLQGHLQAAISGFPTLKPKLDSLAKEIFKNRTNPAAQANNVKEYLTSALAGFQALDQKNRELRQSARTLTQPGRARAGAQKGTASMQPGNDAKNEHVRAVGNPAMSDPLDSTGNPEVDARLTALGHTVEK